MQIEPATAALIVLLGKIWEACCDIVFGMVSDRLKAAGGRRRPFIAAGFVPFCIFFALIWIVPDIASRVGAVLYHGVTYFAFCTVYSAVNVPYQALR